MGPIYYSHHLRHLEVSIRVGRSDFDFVLAGFWVIFIDASAIIRDLRF